MGYESIIRSSSSDKKPDREPYEPIIRSAPVAEKPDREPYESIIRSDKGEIVREGDINKETPTLSETASSRTKSAEDAAKNFITDEKQKIDNLEKNIDLSAEDIDEVREKTGFQKKWEELQQETAALVAKFIEKIDLLNMSLCSIDKNAGLLFKEILKGQEIKKEERERIDNIIKKFGPSLELSDIDSLAVRKNLEHLSFLPDNLVNLMIHKGLKIRIGKGDITDLSKDESLKIKAPRGWKNKSNWKGVAGGYSGNEKIAYAGTAISGSESVALHEYGHGIGHLLELDNASDTIEAHRRLFDKLPTYLQQDGPGEVAGRQEFIADSTADFFMLSKTKFITRYDTQWYDSLEKFINQKSTA